MNPKYWLLKTEPSVFSWDDLKAKKGQTESWEGVRNYQARNFMRDEMKKGDLAFLYHSSCDVPAIMGVIQIVREAYPDPSAWNSKSKYFDPKSNPENPRWIMVDVKLHQEFAHPVTLHQIKQREDMQGLILIQKGSRLSIQPVSAKHFKKICDLGC